MSQRPGQHRRSGTNEGPTRLVMIVEDDSTTLSALERLVNNWGLDTVSFDDFQAARSFLPGHIPHALIVDIRLGQYNGLQLAILARQYNPRMTTIVVSGFDDPVLRAEAQSAGAAYLAKPIDPEALRTLLLADVESSDSLPSD